MHTAPGCRDTNETPHAITHTRSRIALAVRREGEMFTVHLFKILGYLRFVHPLALGDAILAIQTHPRAPPPYVGDAISVIHALLTGTSAIETCHYHSEYTK